MKITHEEIKLATRELLLQNVKGKSLGSVEDIKSMAGTIPNLQRDSGNPKCPPLCKTHNLKDNDPLNEVLCLTKREVSSNLRHLDAFPDKVETRQAEILAYLRALKGMWTTPEFGIPVAPGAWPYEISGCAACILTRIAVDKDALCYLRVVILSRTRSRGKTRPRRLIEFTNECMEVYGSEEVSLMMKTTDADSIQMKVARKACVKEWIENREEMKELASLKPDPLFKSPVPSKKPSALARDHTGVKGLLHRS